MPAGPHQLLHQILLGGAAAVSGLVAYARTSDDVTVLVAVALLSPDPRDALDRARTAATTTGQRQLVAIATAHLAGDVELVDALARDHLADHPDGVLVAWITASSQHLNPTRKDVP